MNLRSLLLSLATWLAPILLIHPASAQQPGKPQNPPPDQHPDLRDVSYGPHERNVFDLYKAKSDKPTPLVIFMHGGGFTVGDKNMVSPFLVKPCLAAGYSVASLNYRYAWQAPFPAPFMDCARALQFLRLHAREYNIDPTRVALTGDSAGGGMSAWIAFHDDMADPKSDDPLARQSTRVRCAALNAGQVSYDPWTIKEWIPGDTWKHPALLKICDVKEEDRDTPHARELFKAASAITYLTADDPPIFAYYSGPKGPPPPDAPQSVGIHSYLFGVKLKEAMDSLHIECILKHQSDYEEAATQQQLLPGQLMRRDVIAFFKKYFDQP